ncbi:MAG: hypothetical protein JW991_02275 [Candidatus Pacebacteria bacterium]|nr:hypothetical protein [Candidatus Paceibacterota bacterium]
MEENADESYFLHEESKTELTPAILEAERDLTQYEVSLCERVSTCLGLKRTAYDYAKGLFASGDLTDRDHRERLREFLPPDFPGRVEYRSEIDRIEFKFPPSSNPQGAEIRYYVQRPEGEMMAEMEEKSIRWPCGINIMYVKNARVLTFNFNRLFPRAKLLLPAFESGRIAIDSDKQSSRNEAGYLLTQWGHTRRGGDYSLFNFRFPERYAKRWPLITQVSWKNPENDPAGNGHYFAKYEELEEGGAAHLKEFSVKADLPEHLKPPPSLTPLGGQEDHWDYKVEDGTCVLDDNSAPLARQRSRQRAAEKERGRRFWRRRRVVPPLIPPRTELTENEILVHQEGKQTVKIPLTRRLSEFTPESLLELFTSKAKLAPST